jgi:hypothetical protein
MNKIILSVTKNESESLINLNEASKAKLVKKHDGKCSACRIDIAGCAYFHEEASKILPLCPLCYYPLHIDKVVMKSPGQIILLPEISQIELNATLRAIEYIKLNSSGFGEIVDAVEIFEVLLKERADLADGFYSEGVSNVSLLSQVLTSLSDEDYSKRETGLYGLRFMHNMSNYGDEMKAWDKELSRFKPDAWKQLIKKVGEYGK